MWDRMGRKIDYLRISITDACNLRCQYCMPEIPQPQQEEQLTLEEILMIVREAAQLGISKVRLTGGEPLMHEKVLEICEGIAQIPGIAQITMTTNGLLLPEKATALRRAGVQRLNISLDTLQAQRYAALTRGGDIRRLWAGLEAARKAGFEQLKLNAVLMNGFNEDEIPAFVEQTREQEIQVRFIELMPMDACASWAFSQYLPADEVLRRVPELVPLGVEGVAKIYQIPGYSGTVGLIRPMSEHFCGACNRLRLTADGKLKPCLHSAREIPLKGANPEQVRNRLLEAISAKPKGHEMQDGNKSKALRPMHRIGG